MEAVLIVKLPDGTTKTIELIEPSINVPRNDPYPTYYDDSGKKIQFPIENPIVASINLHAWSTDQSLFDLK